MLLRLDVSKMPPNPEVHRTDGDFPLAWAKTYGKGRVFYSALGHAGGTWDNRDVEQMYFEAIKWSLGLTDADVTRDALPAASGEMGALCSRGSSPLRSSRRPIAPVPAHGPAQQKAARGAAYAGRGAVRDART